MEIDRDTIVEVFLLEAEENLAAAEDAAIALESQPDDEELVQALFRAVHTLKGSADSLGFAEMTAIAHAVEDLLDGVRGGVFAAGTWLVALVLEAVDALRAAAASVRANGSDESAASPGLVARIDEARARAAEASRSAAGAGEAPARGAAAGAQRCAATTVRVQVETLDAALRTTNEISLALGKLGASLPAAAEAREAHRELSRLCRDLEDQVIALRMVPIGPMFRGFIRTVRDVAATHGKRARLVIDGGDVTIDAHVIERLREPMTHLVRNAIDHGIEAPDERRARGKDPCGRITARARRDAGSVVVQIEDDGAGLRRDRLAAQAKELGLIADPARVSDADLLAVVFAPGFSTADRVTGLSGRGVGMDAVKLAVEALRGTVSIASREGEGTTVTLRMPVSLALLDGFGVGLDDDVFVLPREAVDECVALPATAAERGAGLVDLHGRAVPLVRLRELFARGAGAPERESLVVLRSEGASLALAVDRLYGETKTVISPMSPVFRGARSVAGCAVLGDGRVALALDVDGLFREALRQNAARDAAASEGRS